MRTLAVMGLCLLVPAVAFAEEPDASDVSRLLLQLRSGDRITRLSAAAKLGTVGKTYRERVLPRLVDAFYDRDVVVRLNGGGSDWKAATAID